MGRSALRVVLPVAFNMMHKANASINVNVSRSK